jgi:capsular polysaccharide biosynthesis protein
MRRPTKSRVGWLPDRRLLALAGAVLVAGLVAILALPTTHDAESAIAVRPDAEGVLDAESLELIAHEFVVYLDSAQAVDAVVDDASEVSVAAVQDAQTATIRITVESGDRELAVDVANGLAALAVDKAETDDDARILVIAEATADGATTGPPRGLYLGGLLLATALLVLAGHYALRGAR